LLLLPVVNSAYSAPAEISHSPAIRSELSPFTAVTVGDFLDACRSNQASCTDEIGVALLDKLNLKGAADTCLPSTDYTEAVPAWLNSHPQARNMPTEDGIYLSLKALYPCG